MNPVLAAMTLGSTGNKNLDAVIEAIKSKAVVQDAPGPGDGDDPFPDERYAAGAKMAYYKNEVLNPALRKKNPKAFDDYMAKRVDILKKAGPMAAAKFDEEFPYNEFLTPAEQRAVLGKKYDDFVSAFKTVQKRLPQLGSGKNIVGEVEDSADISALNYGRRMATMPVLTSWTDNHGDGADFEFTPETGVVKKPRATKPRRFPPQP